jgi:hypothetical protein
MIAFRREAVLDTRSVGRRTCVHVSSGVRVLVWIFVAVAIGCTRGTVARPRVLPTPDRFNVLAQRLNLPLYWSDDDGDRAAEPGEVHALLFCGVLGDAADTPPTWVADGRFTPAFERAVERIIDEDVAPVPADPRRALIAAELDLRAPDLVLTDARAWSPEDREFLRRMVVVAHRIDALFSHQRGLDALTPPPAPTDTASAAFLRVTWTPYCTATADPRCSAIEGAPRLIADVWPADLQRGSPDFCSSMSRDAILWGRYSVVRRVGSELVAIPYSEAYADLLSATDMAIQDAADAISSTEPPVAALLRAVGPALRTEDWADADARAREATVENSRWFVHVGDLGQPDWEPCRRKLSYQLTLGRYDADAAAAAAPVLAHIQQLGPALEALAELPERSVPTSRHTTVFVRLVLTAGDDRYASHDGMSWSYRNALYTRGPSPVLTADRTARRASSLASDSIVDADPRRDEAYRVLVLLHEAAHEWAHALSTSDDSAHTHTLLPTIQELVADASATYLASWLGEQHLLDAELVELIRRESANQNAEYASRIQPRAPAVRSAVIQLGLLFELGAASWDSQLLSADGYHGAITIDFARLAAAQQEIARRAIRILATEDWGAAEELAERFVEHSPLPREELDQRAAPQRASRRAFAIDW